MFVFFLSSLFLWFGAGEGDHSAPRAKEGEDLTCLLLRDGRFQVTVDWRGSSTETPTKADGHTLKDETGFDETGFFSLDDSNNIDVVVRVFNACGFDNSFWVFAGAMTDVEYTLTVTDTESGQVREYENELGKPSPPIQDTEAFATCPGPLAEASPTTTGKREEKMSLHEGRFEVNVDFDIPGGQAGKGTVGVETKTSGAFWFLDQSDFNVYLKITDGRQKNGHFWFTYTTFTGAPFTLTVTDTETGVVKNYHNELEQTSYGTDYFLSSPEGANLVFPWISDNDDFNSTLAINNNNCMDADVSLTAQRGDGETDGPVKLTIPAGGFLEEAAKDLFPKLSGGSGYTVVGTSCNSGLSGRWVTKNKVTPSGSSPSQGVATQIPSVVANPLATNARVGQGLQFGLLPLREDFLAGTVLVNVGDAATDVKLYFYDKNGLLLDVDEELGLGLVPYKPLAAVSRDLVPNRSDSVAMVAYSPDQPLLGVTFIFNEDGEPAIGNVTAFDFVPPRR